MRLVHYLAIYLPSVVILMTFYLLIEIVLFIRRKDRILGTTFFKITFVLGLAEMSEVIAIHFLHLFPINGLFLDQIYLKWGAPFPAICNYTVIALGTVQFMLISICSLNRFFVILGSTGAKKDFYDKVTWILMFVLTSISALFYTPIFFAADSMYVDMRNNETNPDDLIMACRCTYNNDQLNNINQLFLLVVKGSNVVFALAVYSCIFIMSIVTKRPAMSKENAKNRGREAKLAIAVFIHTIIAGSSLFLLIGFFYIWPNNFSLIIPVYILEDISRMFSPILLFIFSKPLRTAFSQIYLSRISFFNTVGSSVMVTKVSKIAVTKSFVQSNSRA